MVEALTTTVSDVRQPPPAVVVVTMYDVVVSGDASGLAMSGLFKPMAGDHLYTSPGFGITPIPTGSLLHDSISFPAFEVTVSESFTLTDMVFAHP